HVFPLRESAWLLTILRCFRIVVQVLAHSPRAIHGVPAEQILQLRKQIRLRSEVAEPLIPTCQRVCELLPHTRSVIAMEAVAFDEGRLEMLAAENLLEGLADRRGAGARGAGDCDDRMAGRHGIASVRCAECRARAWRRAARRARIRCGRGDSARC